MYESMSLLRLLPNWLENKNIVVEFFLIDLSIISLLLDKYSCSMLYKLHRVKIKMCGCILILTPYIHVCREWMLRVVQTIIMNDVLITRWYANKEKWCHAGRVCVHVHVCNMHVDVCNMHGDVYKLYVTCMSRALQRMGYLVAYVGEGSAGQ